MLGFLNPTPFPDSRLGVFERSGGVWCGRLALARHGTVELRLSGDRKAPSPFALARAYTLPSDYEALIATLESELFEHYAPYRDVTDHALRLDSPADVWAFLTVPFVSIDPGNRQFDVQIAYRVTWDEEHTLAARLRDGRFIELCGSV